MSLIGHYERIAQYLFRNEALRSYPAVDSMHALRIRARSLPSMLRACAVMAHHLLFRPGPLIGIPRSNSRAIQLLTRLFPRARYFSYSDGLGDSIHRFYLQDSINYVGHVGFPSLARQPLIHEIPLSECIEPWGDRIEFDPTAPVLVIVKTPKETNFDAAHVARLYERTIRVVARHRPVLISGGVPGLALPESIDARTIGSLMTLPGPLRISGAIGLPSTAFLTLVTRLPPQRLRVMRLCCRFTYPDADRRIVSMKHTLEHCMNLLVARGEQEPTRTDPKAKSTP
ncbi:hypothetical protein [Piscinibacter sp.]|uniref:hypothetical protein n=1 Tax=Piscinibacter sp. TaxID=1903157 RepID=UPI0025E1589F|nr:hypothetical protein [Piscinibacter sp.]